MAYRCHRPDTLAVIVKRNMAARIWDNSWIEDRKLKEELRKYVSQGLRREEILDYVKRDFSKYAWSYRTLDRRLRAFDIYFMDREVHLEQVQAAVQKELDGPGKLLGYRAMQNKLRQEHNLLVPRDLVHAVMFDLDEEGLAARCPAQFERREGLKDISQRKGQIGYVH